MNLERTILTNLKNRHPDLMPVGTLWAEVKLDEPEATYSEFKEALTELEVKGQALVIKGEDRDKAKITDKGRARLME
jgi:hypothetical protein